jgi:nicotinate-nucleotide pyrophosphorylase (carboxylating)
MLAPPAQPLVWKDVENALAEDMGAGDVTAQLLPADAFACAELTCREPAVIAGTAWFDACFRQLDPHVQIDWLAADGQQVLPDTLICRLSGNARALVSAERSALNFLQLLSGTATLTAAHVAAIGSHRARVLDTRKTVPGLRLAQKYAVRCGGGQNHRMGLYDAVLIKENHIIAAGGIATAVQAARQRYPQLMLEVEVENPDELAQALDACVHRILLDNFSLSDMAEAVRHTAGRAELEASGNIDLQNIGAHAATGVDFISVGALTKHVHAIDLSLRLQLR